MFENLQCLRTTMNDARHTARHLFTSQLTSATKNPRVALIKRLLEAL